MPVPVSLLVNLVRYTDQLYTACTITRSSLSYLLLPPRVPSCFHVGWAVGRGHWNTHIWNMEETRSLKISLFHVQSHKPPIFLLVSSGRSEREGKKCLDTRTPFCATFRNVNLIGSFRSSP